MKEKNNNLKQVRKERGLTVKEVVDSTGIPMRTYQNYEYMEREIGAGALQRLADFYNVSTDYLLGREQSHQDTSIDTDKIETYLESIVDQVNLIKDALKK